nr:isoform 2 of gamma-tubulin complex component 2 [Quercus suber]
MNPDYFPALEYLDLSETDIIIIPESINRFARLRTLIMDNCKQLQEIPRLPQFIRKVYAKNCLSLTSQSSSKLLIQIGEILNLLPNRVCKGARSDISMDPLSLAHLNDSNISEQNHIEIICEIMNEWSTSSSSLEPRKLTGIIKIEENENNLIKFQEIHLLPCCFTICHAFNAKKFVVMDDLLVGTEGRYILVTRVHVKEDEVALQVDLSMNLALQHRRRSGEHSTVFTAELDKEEDDDVADGTDGKYIEKVLDVEKAMLCWKI